MVVVDLDGKVVEGDLRPSSDTPTHLVLYRAFRGGRCRPYSFRPTLRLGHRPGATSRISEPPSRLLPRSHSLYARHGRDRGRGRLRKRRQATSSFAASRVESAHTPGVLVKNHGPFAWGRDAADAVHNAVVMEQVAKMAYIAYGVNPHLTMNPSLIEKHFSRKHGPNAYYGQKRNSRSTRSAKRGKNVNVKKNSIKKLCSKIWKSGSSPVHSCFTVAMPLSLSTRTPRRWSTA